ncbi:MAG: MaoC family dehydratase N-terminal domain-containing protein [Rhodospirillales bacterium]|nr:MAG: MaoC family dehydratase N-terminal domain-containing protein [Rhodospirillales bacterium]
MHTRWFEEFESGDKFESRGATLTESQIVDFALTYDPQQMHVDAAAAADGAFGGLIASGFQTLALSFRLFFDLGLVARSNIVGPGMDEVRWLAPVRPGDTLRSVAEVLEVRESRSRPDRGTVRFGFTVKNQRDEVVLTYQALTIIRRRPEEG